MRRIIYHAGAQRDALKIVEYYEQEAGPSAADNFVSELRLFIEAIAERPESYTKQTKDIRRANLYRFPYHVLFRILDDKTIKILAVKHDRRDPSFARGRK